MFVLLEIVSVLFVSTAMAVAVTQALELASKLRLERALPAGIQALHHPVIHNRAFTTGGLISEAGGLATLLLMILTMPFKPAALGWAFVSLCLLAGMHLAYWTRMHPADQFTHRDPRATSIAPVGFFATHPRPVPPLAATGWYRVRYRWEHSHTLRVVLAALSLTSLVTAVALN
jgi:hypothetical protein